MKKQSIILLLIILVGIVGGWLLFKENNYHTEKELVRVEMNKSSTLSAEAFIRDHLIHKEGTIRTNFTDEQEGNVALSESIGLWMEYLVEKGDSKQFEQAFYTVNELFLLDNDLIAWKVEDGIPATTNALIDDIRIVEALFSMGKKEGNTEYIETAKKIAEAILAYNRHEEYFVDFYDTAYGYQNEEITLSYLIPEAFQSMVEYDLMRKEEMDQLRVFMQEIPLKDGFYPKSYDVTEQLFTYDETINLIDQLYVSLHLERIGVNTDPFYRWFKMEFYRENLLYGRYDRLTKKRAVNYEAVSVYALAIMYSMEKQDFTFAGDLYEQMITMQNQDTSSAFYGGYMSGNSTHSFDNLLALLAERILRNEQIIQSK